MTTTPLLNLLAELETEMDQLGYWSSNSPPPESFNSQLPFCADTLDFPAWLQWVFLPRLKEIHAKGHDLPFHSQIMPYASHYFSTTHKPKGKIVLLLGKLDSLLNKSTHHLR